MALSKISFPLGNSRPARHIKFAIVWDFAFSKKWHLLWVQKRFSGQLSSRLMTPIFSMRSTGCWKRKRPPASALDPTMTPYDLYKAAADQSKYDGEVNAGAPQYEVLDSETGKRWDNPMVIPDGAMVSLYTYQDRVQEKMTWKLAFLAARQPTIILQKLFLLLLKPCQQHL